VAKTPCILGGLAVRFWSKTEPRDPLECMGLSPLVFPIKGCPLWWEDERRNPVHTMGSRGAVFVPNGGDAVHSRGCRSAGTAWCGRGCACGYWYGRGYGYGRIHGWRGGYPVPLTEYPCPTRTRTRARTCKLTGTVVGVPVPVRIRVRVWVRVRSAGACRCGYRSRIGIRTGIRTRI